MVRLNELLKKSEYRKNPRISTSNFDDNDTKLLNNPKAKKKLNDAFLKVPYDFNIYFYDSIKVFGGMYEINDQRLYDRALYNFKQSDFDNNAINVVFVGNDASDKHPITPWVIAHRIGHIIFDYGDNTNSYKTFGAGVPLQKQILKNVWSKFVVILNQGYGIPLTKYIHAQKLKLSNDDPNFLQH